MSYVVRAVLDCPTDCDIKVKHRHFVDKNADNERVREFVAQENDGQAAQGWPFYNDLLDESYLNHVFIAKGNEDLAKLLAIARKELELQALCHAANRKVQCNYALIK